MCNAKILFYKFRPMLRHYKNHYKDRNDRQENDQLFLQRLSK